MTIGWSLSAEIIRSPKEKFYCQRSFVKNILVGTQNLCQ